MDVTLAEVVAASRAVAATRSRTAKTQALADLFARCDPAEVGLVVSHLSGVLPQRRLGVGLPLAGLAARPGRRARPHRGRGRRRVHPAGGHRGSRLHGIPPGRAGRADGPRDRRRAALPRRPDHRQPAPGRPRRRGARRRREGVCRARRRRASRHHARAAPPPRWPRLAAAGGVEALEQVGLVVGRPVRPMLAASAKTAGEAVDAVGGGDLLVDGKLDGIRVQVHRRSGEVTVYTRSLDEITERVPEVVEAVAALPGGDLVLDGEAIVMLDDGRPAPFQVTGARTASSADVAGLRERVPLTTFLFDVLHRDGVDLIDEPARVRHDALVELAAAPGGPTAAHQRPGGRRGVLRPARRRRPRGGRGQGRRQPVRRGPPRQRLGQGQADAHPRPRRARRRVGFGPSPGHARRTSTSAPATPRPAAS